MGGPQLPRKGTIGASTDGLETWGRKSPNSNDGPLPCSLELSILRVSSGVQKTRFSQSKNPTPPSLQLSFTAMWHTNAWGPESPFPGTVLKVR